MTTEPLHPTDTQIMTASGALVDLLRPRAGDISIRDIAAGLSRINRFNGAARVPYSVAQHSVHVAELAFAGTGAAMACCALLHDAHEVYIGDIATPVAKALMLRSLSGNGQLAAVTEALDAAIAEACGIEWDAWCLAAPEVKHFDRAMFQAEFRDLMPADVTYVWSPDPAPIHVKPWRWDKAEEKFLDAWTNYSTLAGLPDTSDQALGCHMFGDGEAS